MIPEFWATARATIPGLPRHTIPVAWAFGDTPEMADELAALVVEGKKTATCSLYAEYVREGESLPEVGQLNILLDGQGKPVALLETTEVELLKFSEVSEELAAREGEGDLSLDYWRTEHRRFWSKVKGFDDSAIVVAEGFKVLFVG